MEIITEIEEANNLLKSYFGGKLQIAFYSESLKRIAIRISLTNKPEVVYLIGIGCESICGRFSFSNVNLTIAIKADDMTKDNITKISDVAAGFELTGSGGFTLAKGYESDFGTSFDDFIKNR